MDAAILNQFYGDLTKDKRPTGRLLIMLGGLPYSGKSTLAEALSDSGFVHVWATTIKKRHGLKDAEMFDLVAELIRRLLGEGYPVVFDFLNHTDALRERMAAVARETKALCAIVWMDTPIEEIYRRQESVGAGAEGRSAISKEVIEIIRAEVEEPIGEGVIRVNKSTDIHDTVARLSAMVGAS